jgi:trimeric autotransporter adhesin
VNLYITDANNNRIRKVDSTSGTITTVAGNGVAGFSGDSGPATSAQLNYPDGIGLDSNGNYFIGDARNNRVREVTLATGVISTVAGNGVPGLAGDGTAATGAELYFPSRPFINSAGDIYIADFQNNCVRKVSAATGIITTVAGNGLSGYSGDRGPATSAQLNGPISVALDTAGDLFIADANNGRIRAVNTGTSAVTLLGVTIQPGQIATVAGDGVAGFTGDGGLATAAEINGPTGLLVDSGGNLYFADSHNNVIRKVTGP